MQKIVYYVATSIDGYICGKEGDASGFVGKGEGVTRYQQDLEAFDTVIMGRKTYEFGYDFGLSPGELAYPHMDHYIFSKTLSLENHHEKVHLVPEFEVQQIMEIKAKSKTDIYLCGGGIFAGWLLAHTLIDVLKIKLNPLLLGSGVRLFGNSDQEYQLNLLETEGFDYGLFINTYEILYPK
jgi:dihydrofolate reductase